MEQEVRAAIQEFCEGYVNLCSGSLNPREIAHKLSMMQMACNRDFGRVLSETEKFFRSMRNDKGIQFVRKFSRFYEVSDG
jgi:hypothetical protein